MSAVNALNRRRYEAVKSGSLRPADATEGELARALSAAYRLNDYEVAARIELELARREDPDDVGERES